MKVIRLNVLGRHVLPHVRVVNINTDTPGMVIAIEIDNHLKRLITTCPLLVAECARISNTEPSVAEKRYIVA